LEKVRVLARGEYGELHVDYALVTTVLKRVAGKRLLYSPLTGTSGTPAIGIARATKVDVTPAGERLCRILRQISEGVVAA
jgi:hypothetical protein